MSAPAKNPATYADLAAVPPHLVAEILAGELVTHPRPAPRHAAAAAVMGIEIGNPFQRGKGGPGGWIFLVEPELHFGFNVLVPDLAGWRRERLPTEPETAYIEIPPDWVCEIISPATALYDRGAKRRLYAAAGVPYLWLLDPSTKMLEAFTLTGGQWLLVGVATGDDTICLPPFDAISFPLSILFPFDDAPSNSSPSQG